MTLTLIVYGRCVRHLTKYTLPIPVHTYLKYPFKNKVSSTL